MYYPGKSNIVANTLSRSRSREAEAKTSAHQGLRNNQDNQYDDDSTFIFTISSKRHHQVELREIREAQKADPALREFMELPKAELK